MDGKHHEYLSIATFILVLAVIVVIAAYMDGFKFVASKGTSAKSGSGGSGSTTITGAQAPNAPSS